MIRTVKMSFEPQPLLMQPPHNPGTLYGQACSGDAVTIDTWKDIWLKNIRENHKRFGPFGKSHIGQYFNCYDKKPVIVAGSGPGLKNSVTEFEEDEDGSPLEKRVSNLRNTKGIPLISCLHNYHFMEDRGIHPDFYVTLDAGEVTVEEVYEGGEATAEAYWASTKDKHLIAFIGTSPRLIEKWQGEVIWFNCPIPSPEIMAEVDKLETFSCYVSSGGNVLGACVYLAKYFGANPVIFIGADFSFGYEAKFHAWNSKYDANPGQVMATLDIWGHRVTTWQSYYNFKCFFDWLAMTVPGIWINSTESGIMGAYPEGNLIHILQLPLRNVIDMYSLNEPLKGSAANPGESNKLILF
jgi:hypothetical protein